MGGVNVNSCFVSQGCFVLCLLDVVVFFFAFVMFCFFVGYVGVLFVGVAEIGPWLSPEHD